MGGGLSLKVGGPRGLGGPRCAAEQNRFSAGLCVLLLPAAAAVVRPHVMSFDNVVLFVQATFEHALASGGRCGIARTRKLGTS